mmetsp:Transcript_26234/g.37540  ORF Transcript_26234/g.37540 Transcript_26234/m.37540 type:complete len:204 (-) Transcript_26234:224-835(-)
MSGHTGFVMTIMMLNDKSTTLISGARDGNIKLWNTSDGSCLKTISAHEGTVRCLTQFHIRGELMFASGGVDMKVKIWKMDGSSYKVLTGHADHVYSLVYLHDGRLASGSRDHSAKIWDLDNFSCLRTLSGHGSDIFCMVQLEDGQLLTGSGDKSIKFWNANKPDVPLVKTLDNAHTADVYSLVQLKDGRLASASVDKSIVIWA